MGPNKIRTDNNQIILHIDDILEPMQINEYFSLMVLCESYLRIHIDEEYNSFYINDG